MGCSTGGLVHAVNFCSGKNHLGSCHRKAWLTAVILSCLMNLTPTERRELLAADRQRRLGQARVDERVERGDVRERPLPPSEMPTTADWIASRKEVGITVNPDFIDKEFRTMVEKEIEEADKGAHAFLGDKIPQRKKRNVRQERNGDPRPQPPVGQVPLPVPVVARAPRMSDPYRKYREENGYQYLDHACPFCNGMVRISPRLQRTVCMGCQEVLWPLECEPLLNESQKAAKVCTVEVKPDVFLWALSWIDGSILARNMGRWPIR